MFTKAFIYEMEFNPCFINVKSNCQIEFSSLTATTKNLTQNKIHSVYTQLTGVTIRISIPLLGLVLQVPAGTHVYPGGIWQYTDDTQNNVTRHAIITPNIFTPFLLTFH